MQIPVKDFPPSGITRLGKSWLVGRSQSRSFACQQVLVIFYTWSG